MPREAAERAAEQPRVHIGSVDVQIIAPPTHATPVRASAAGAVPSRSLARGLTSIIGLRQS